jgi:hypothetical protein
MGWFFRQPLVPLFIEVVGAFVVVTVLVVALTEKLRIHVRDRFPRSFEQAAFYGTQIWLAYTLILSLTAVGAWSEYQAASEKVSHEVATLEVLQRRAVLYPEPMRTEMDDLIREYARTVADREWPEQGSGEHPSAGKQFFGKLNVLLGEFEPGNLPDQMVHAETLRELTSASEARRARIHATSSSLPGVVWLVMLVGAALALVGATTFVPVDDKTAHLALVSLMAAFVGLVVFVTVALDHPFQGAVTPSADGFRLIADRPFGGG